MLKEIVLGSIGVWLLLGLYWNVREWGERERERGGVDKLLEILEGHYLSIS
jgi:hypothetical protein